MFMKQSLEPKLSRRH